MASITNLLATDSLASSRIVINDNFNSLNDELTDVTDLLDPTQQTLSISGGIQASGITLIDGSLKFSVTSTDVTVGTGIGFTAGGVVVLEQGFRHSIVTGATTVPGAGQYFATTYGLDASAFGSAVTLAAGDAGQEITLIAEGGQIVIDHTNIAGATSVTILADGTLTLRYVGSFWYIISHVNCTVAF